jgi:hypothetical protein
VAGDWRRVGGAFAVLVFSLVNPALSQERTLDDEYAAIAREVPGFGGLYFDRQTNTIVAHSAIPENDFAVREAVREYLNGSLLSGLPISTIRGLYDYRDLNRWRREIEIAASGLLSMSDVDERRNRVLIGIRSDDAMKKVTEIITGLNLPEDAVVLEFADFVAPRAPRDSIRSMVGGMRRQLALPQSTYSVDQSCLSPR